MASDKKLDLNEQISCLMDNVQDDLELDARLDDLGSQTELQNKWQRYHLIRDVVQKEYQPALPTDFCTRVSAAIENESFDESSFDPASDQTSNRNHVQSAATVTDFAAAKERVRSASDAKASSNKGWSRNVAGFAVAASVAMVALVGVNVFQNDDGANPGLVASAGDTDTTSAGGASSEILGAQPRVVVMGTGSQLEFVSNSGTYWVSAGDNKLSPANESRLNMYLSQHMEASPTAGVQGMLPYSRLAGYDSFAARQQAADAE